MPENEAILSAEFQQRVGIVMDADLAPEEKASAIGSVASDVLRRLSAAEAGEKTVVADKALGILSWRPGPEPEPATGSAAHVDDLLRHGAVGTRPPGNLPSSN